MSGQNLFLLLGTLAVAIIVAAWLIYFIAKIRKTKKAYKDIMDKKQKDAIKNDSSESITEDELLRNQNEEHEFIQKG